jgi:hypothetical protein
MPHQRHPTPFPPGGLFGIGNLFDLIEVIL